MTNPKELFELLTADMTPGQARAAMRFSWRVGLAVAMVFAYGGFAWLGFPGFAWGSDVRSLRDEVGSIKVEIIEQQIWDTRVRQCEAVREQQKDTARLYGERLSQLLAKYQGITSRSYQLLSCAEQ